MKFLRKVMFAHIVTKFSNMYNYEYDDHSSVCKNTSDVTVISFTEKILIVA